MFRAVAGDIHKLRLAHNVLTQNDVFREKFQYCLSPLLHSSFLLFHTLPSHNEHIKYISLGSKCQSGGLFYFHNLHKFDKCLSPLFHCGRDIGRVEGVNRGSLAKREGRGGEKCVQAEGEEDKQEGGVGKKMMEEVAESEKKYMQELVKMLEEDVGEDDYEEEEKEYDGEEDGELYETEEED